MHRALGLALLFVACSTPTAVGSTVCARGDPPMEGEDLSAVIRVEFAEGSRPAGYFKGNIWVNGQLTTGIFAMRSVLAAPGKLHVEVARAWLGGQKGGLASIDVEGAAGETICLFYEKGALPIFPGTLTRIPAAK